MTRTTLAVLLLATSCALPRAASKSGPAAAEYDATHRDLAWSRALRALQARGYIVAVSDKAGGLITTQTMAGSSPCGILTCRSRDTVQILLSTDGRVSVDLHRELWSDMTSSSGWFAPGDENSVGLVEQEQADILREILKG